jgi:NADPH:quinone reductase-like Zn-dependent oxidoreductase
MKAIAFAKYGPADVLQPMDLPLPEPGNGQVRIRVHASTVNPVDWKLRRGMMRFIVPVRFPKVPGWDVAGTVDQVGEGVTGLTAGQPVFGHMDVRGNGACAEYTVTRAAWVVPKPASLSFEQAAAIPGSGVTALWSVRDLGELKAGERMLVIGASGGVGTFAVQIGKALGAHVTGVCSSRNVELVRGLGADAVLAYDRERIPEGAKFDVIFDTVKAARFRKIARRLTKQGRYVATLPDPVGMMMSKLLWPLGYRKRCRMIMMRPDGNRLADLAALVQVGKVRPVIDRTYPLADLAEAHRYSETHRARGKIVVTVLTEGAGP